MWNENRSPTYAHRNITLSSMPLNLMLYNPVQHNYVKKIVMFSCLLCTLHTVSKTTEFEFWREMPNKKEERKETIIIRRKKITTKTTYCYTNSSTGEEEAKEGPQQF